MRPRRSQSFCFAGLSICLSQAHDSDWTSNRQRQEENSKSSKVLKERTQLEVLENWLKKKNLFQKPHSVTSAVSIMGQKLVTWLCLVQLPITGVIRMRLPWLVLINYESLPPTGVKDSLPWDQRISSGTWTKRGFSWGCRAQHLPHRGRSLVLSLSIFQAPTTCRRCRGGKNDLISFC